MKIKGGIVILLILSGCIQKSHESDKAVVDVDSIKKERIKEEETVIKAAEIIDPKTFISYERSGVLPPASFIKYNDRLDSIGSLSVKQFESVKILKKTYGKLPLHPEDDYCDYMNFLKVVVDKDTSILSGGNVLEITDFYNRLQLKNDTVNLILAENFLMKSADDDGLTGCADFSYLLIEDDNIFSYVSPQNNSDNLTETTLLYHNDGIEQKIKDIKAIGDTLILEISEIYQDGRGSRDINVFWNVQGWSSSESNVVSPYYE